MPTPDLTPYVDLRLYDRDASDLVDRAALDIATKIPGWVPRSGDTALVVIEALALVVAELVYALNRIPSATTMALIGLFGVERDDGTPPTATVTVTAVDNAGYTLDAGSMLRLDVGGEVGSVLFTTDGDLIIPALSTTGVVAVTGTTNTEEANGTPIGTALDLISSAYFVETVELATAVADGTDPEDDAAWLDRGRAALARLVSTLVLPDHFTAAALTEADVVRATTIDLYDGVGGSPGSDTGHVTVAVLGAGGATLSGGRKTEIEAALEEQAIAGLDVHVVDPTITAVEVDVTVLRRSGYDSATVEASVDAALEAYLDPEVWDWAGTVYLNELIALIDAVDGVDRVTALTIEGAAADFALTGDAPLADYDAAASVTTVTAP